MSLKTEEEAKKFLCPQRLTLDEGNRHCAGKSCMAWREDFPHWKCKKCGHEEYNFEHSESCRRWDYTQKCGGKMEEITGGYCAML